MDKSQAEEAIREKVKSCLRTTKHCRARMIDRDVTMEDIRYVIQWGKVSTIEWDADYGNWKIEVKGGDIDGEELTLILVLLDDAALCVTVC
jgi:hypothetical protein